jgi:hypothetical protein
MSATKDKKKAEHHYWRVIVTPTTKHPATAFSKIVRRLKHLLPGKRSHRREESRARTVCSAAIRTG